MSPPGVPWAVVLQPTRGQYAKSASERVRYPVSRSNQARGAAPPSSAPIPNSLIHTGAVKCVPVSADTKKAWS